jgi:GH3 auxin-responsive promoter
MRRRRTPDRAVRHAWLEAVLARNAHAAYLRQFDSPASLQALRERVPATTHEALVPWLDRVAGGEPDVLFEGCPVAYERTGGSSGGGKLIPYTADGLRDFEAALAPWLAAVVSRFALSGSVYLATSPATRPAERIGGTPLGLPDGAYLGAHWGQWVAGHSAVPLDVARETSVAIWRERTLACLAAAHDLEMISVWSPTFLLRLLDDLPDPRAIWPRLKLVSCWSDGASRGPAAELRARLPHAHLQPKGLMSTECVVATPDALDRPVLAAHGFFEFERHGEMLLAGELEDGGHYEVVATTASGLYRYRTGDLVLCKGFTGSAMPVLEFQGRTGIVSDLVGEKLVEAFVQDALTHLPAGSFLTVQRGRTGYAVVTQAGVAVDLDAIEASLMRNPQYAYARIMKQLEPLAHRPVDRLYDRFVEFRLAQGSRLADIKPVALVPDAGWIG